MKSNILQLKTMENRKMHETIADIYILQDIVVTTQAIQEWICQISYFGQKNLRK